MRVMLGENYTQRVSQLNMMITSTQEMRRFPEVKVKTIAIVKSYLSHVPKAVKFSCLNLRRLQGEN